MREGEERRERREERRGEREREERRERREERRGEEREERLRKRERESPAHLYNECLFGSELKKIWFKTCVSFGIRSNFLCCVHLCLFGLNPTFYCIVIWQPCQPNARNAAQNAAFHLSRVGSFYPGVEGPV